jgi:hypothetical protein
VTMHKYIPDDYLLGQTGTTERSASAPITARRPAVLIGLTASAVWLVNQTRKIVMDPRNLFVADRFEC